MDKKQLTERDICTKYILPAIKQALLLQAGQLGKYLELAKAFEQADWQLQQQLSQQVLHQPQDLSPIYLQAVTWAEGLLQG